jgi:hypothetical protein
MPKNQIKCCNLPQFIGSLFHCFSSSVFKPPASPSSWSEQEILMETQDWLWKTEMQDFQEHDMSLNREGKNLFLAHSL